MPAPRRMRSPRTTLLAVVVALAVVATLFLKYFTGWAIYDDEGYMLVSLNGVASGHRLYTDVFSQYGPAFFLVLALPLRLLGVEWTAEAARFATIGLTTATAFAMAWSVRRISGSTVFAVATGALTAVTIGTEAALHPTHLVLVFTALIVVGVTLLDHDPRSRAAIALVGTSLGLALLVKVNVGVVASVAVSYAALDLRPRAVQPVRHYFPVIAAIGLLALAALGGDATQYLVALAFPTLVFTAATRPSRLVSGASLPAVALATALAAALCLAVFALDGSAVADLVRGVILDPLRQADAFAFGSQLSATTLALLALTGAAAMWLRRSGGLGPDHRIAGALFVLGCVVAHGRWPLVMRWDALVVGAAVAALLTPTASSHAVRLLKALAVLLPLTAYPVAGGQVEAALLTLPAFAFVVIADALAERHADPARAEAAVALAAACGSVVLLAASWSNWASLQPLGPARLVHGDKQDVRSVASVAGVLTRHCQSFYSLPGLNSFYGFADMTPPTQHNATSWMTLFDAERQAQVVRALERTRNLCVVHNPAAELFWTTQGEQRPGPLRAFLAQADDRVARVGDYVVYRFSPRAAPH